VHICLTLCKCAKFEFLQEPYQCTLKQNPLCWFMVQLLFSLLSPHPLSISLHVCCIFRGEQPIQPRHENRSSAAVIIARFLMSSRQTQLETSSGFIWASCAGLPVISIFYLLLYIYFTCQFFLTFLGPAQRFFFSRYNTIFCKFLCQPCPRPKWLNGREEAYP
jgi:hypothetical protein